MFDRRQRVREKHLAHDVLYLNALVEKGAVCEEEPARVKSIKGWEHLDEVVMVDQSPIVRTRAPPLPFMPEFLKKYAPSSQKRRRPARGLKPGFFSFNSGDGRCPRCMGMGSEKVEMQFLSDIFVQCPLCHGSRYGSEVLSVYRDGRNIADVLGMTVAAALECFSAEKGAKASRIASKLGVLQRVGLGHLTLGQPLNTLSGGENQRLKLAKILLDQIGSGANSSKMLILDEPGTGLHFADIEVLLAVFRELVEQGHTLLVIEHNPEFIKSADYVIDLGPEGGAGGGHVVATGTPEEIVAAGKGYTGKYLREVLKATLPFTTLRTPPSRNPQTWIYRKA